MIVWLDCETGGLIPLACALLSVACIRDDATYMAVIRPAEGLAIEPQATAVNGLAPDVLAPGADDAHRLGPEVALQDGIR